MRFEKSLFIAIEVILIGKNSFHLSKGSAKVKASFLLTKELMNFF
jgi:hypothetical protein